MAKTPSLEDIFVGGVILILIGTLIDALRTGRPIFRTGEY